MRGFIYKITNLITKKVYIGSTEIEVRYRYKIHKRDFCNKYLRTDKRTCIKLYNSFYEYGLECFIIEEIEMVIINCKMDLLIRERFYQEKYDTVNNGLNLIYACSNKQQRRQNDNETRQKRRNERKMFCELCNKHYNYDSHKEHINSKNHQVKLGNQQFKVIGRQKDYDKERYERLKEEKNKLIKCSCGVMVSQQGLNRHKKTKKHIKLLSLNTQ